MDFLFLISIVLSRDISTESRIESSFTSLIREMEVDLGKTAFQAAQADFNSNTNPGKSLNQIHQEYQLEAAQLLTTFKPYARQIIENAAYNKYYNYYIWNGKAWHMYGKQPSNPPVDGSLENTKILGAELKAAWMKLLGSNNSSFAAMTMTEF